jgi:hypothetical protein
MNRIFSNLLVSFAALVIACSGASPNQSCTPGESVACVGPGGCNGGQACNAQGTAFDPCSCTIGVGDGGFGDAADAGFGNDGDAAPADSSLVDSQDGAPAPGSACTDTVKYENCPSYATPSCPGCTSVPGVGCGYHTLCEWNDAGKDTICSGGIFYAPAGGLCPLNTAGICDGAGFCVTGGCGGKNQPACPGACLPGQGNCVCNTQKTACCSGWSVNPNTNSGGTFCCGTIAC